MDAASTAPREPGAHWRTRVAANLLAGCVVAGAFVAWRGASEARPASAAEVDAALQARGVAWIWPASNGPVVTRVPAWHEAAVLVETLRLHADGVERVPRTQPLVLPAAVKLLPVLHVEAADDAPDTLTTGQLDAVVAAFMRHADTAARGAGMLQLDFEAPRRERASYQALVARLRSTLPRELRLSVTALAHWCTESDWLDRLPVDEVVPMLYRLGPDAARWRARWQDGGAGLARRCRGPALGFLTRDPPSAALLARTPRPYWFDESAWTNVSRPVLPSPPSP